MYIYIYVYIYIYICFRFVDIHVGPRKGNVRHDLRKKTLYSGTRVPRPSLHFLACSLQPGDDSGQIFDHCLTKLVRPRRQELERIG